jgi:bacterioferritin-associated ferredoxin
MYVCVCVCVSGLKLQILVYVAMHRDRIFISYTPNTGQ